ncbi:hypothetical protein BH23GEM11_BH23GEM11_14120 [soil metagenome]
MKKFIRSAIAVFGAIFIGVSGAHALHGATAQESTCEDDKRCSSVIDVCHWDAIDRKCEVDDFWGCTTSIGECPWS